MSDARVFARGPATALLLALLAGGTTGALGQQQGRDRGCTVVIEPATDSTESISVEVEPDTYVTHVRNGLRWTCGDARMVADSAVRYEEDRRLEMIGAVDYRDSVRTLLADRVVYYQRDDRIEARGNVRLTRRATGSTLEGPEVDFLRVESDRERRTVATDRPLLTLRRDTASTDSSPPVLVEGDSVVLSGEETARARGNVEIRRPDMEARADSAVFRTEEERGRLYGSPKVTGSTWSLTGRTLRTRFEDGDLREVLAEDEGHASGDDFDLFAPRIRARTADRQIDKLWAYGDERPVAYSPPYRLAADSLEFLFGEGEIDEVRAVDDASAVEVGDRIPEDPRSEDPRAADDRSWVTADTIVLAFARASAARGGSPDGDLQDDSLPEALPGGPPSASDSTYVTVLTPADSLVDVSAPRPDDVDGEATPDSTREGGEEAAESDDREIRTLRATSRARAYYLLEPDEPGGRPAKHYQIGREIVVHFEEGDAVLLEGKDAVGVHLDPTDEAVPGPSAPDDARRDTTRAAPPDSTEAPRDTTEARPDSTAAPPDSAGGGEGGGGR